MKKNLIYTLLLPLLLLSNYTAQATTPIPTDRPSYQDITTIFQVIQGYEKIAITTDLDSLILNKRKEVDQAAFLQLTGAGQPTIQFDIKVQARGKYRRKVCDFPPVRLNFSKKDLRKQGWYGKYDKLKLVTPCLENKASEQALLKEYWTYRMYNQLTENSFQVHLLEVVYVHEKDPTRTIKSKAFIIENTKEMAHRLGGRLVDALGVQPTQLTNQSYHHALLFNYMVGNTDWRLHVQKNLKLVQREDQTLLTLVPYDFDYAKLVDAPYMHLEAYKGVVDLENRHAKGYFANEEALQQVATQFKALQKTGFQAYKDCDHLKKKEKAKMTLFIKSFYKTLKDEMQLKETFLAVVD